MNLVNLPKVNPSEVYSDIQAIKTYWNGLVEADEEAKKGFIRANNGVNDLGGMIVTFLESIGENGSNLESIDVNQLQTAIFGDKELLETITNKMNEGESLGPAERELLYHYIQENILNEEVFEQMDRISELMKYDNDQLKDYINEEVLATEGSLTMEIFLLEMYLFAGNKRPSELRGTAKDRIRLNNYLTMLTNYQLLISEQREENDWKRDLDAPLYMRIVDINFEFMKSPINGHLESHIIFTYDPDQYDQSGISREDFLELKDPPFSYHSISVVEYFYEPNPIEDFKERQVLDSLEEINTHTGSFVSSQLFELALSLIPNSKLADLSYIYLTATADNKSNIKENEKNTAWKKIEQTASEFYLELQTNENDIYGEGQEIEVLLQPTNKTFELIDRWNAIHLIDDEFPYPKSQIQNLDWIGMNNFLYENENKGDMKMTESDILILDYILNGTESDHTLVQEAMQVVESK